MDKEYKDGPIAVGALTPPKWIDFRAPLSVRRYVYVSTLLGVFSQALYIWVGSAIFIFYFVMLSNLLLIWAFLRPLVFPRWLAWFLLYLMGSGLLGILRGTDTIFLAAKQAVAIGFSLFYFVNFFRLQNNSIDRCWATYVKVAYWLTLVAIGMWPIQCLLAHGFERMHGIASEPSEYCILTMPAYYWYGRQWLVEGKCRKEALWITLGIAFSASSTGLLTVLFGIVLLFGKRLTTILLASVVAGGLGTALYVLSPDVQLRVDDTAAALSDSDVSNTNLSTYALISNMFVTGQVLQVHPLLGNGLGSHMMSNQRYIEEVPGQEAVDAAGGKAGANLQDASSLTLRSLSEMGMVGFLGILWFIKHFRVDGTGYRGAVSSAILMVFFQKILRNGGYSSPEQFFFVMLYILNSKQFTANATAITEVRAVQRLPSAIKGS